MTLVSANGMWIQSGEVIPLTNTLPVIRKDGKRKGFVLYDAEMMLGHMVGCVWLHPIHECAYPDNQIVGHTGVRYTMDHDYFKSAMDAVMDFIDKR